MSYYEITETFNLNSLRACSGRKCRILHKNTKKICSLHPSLAAETWTLHAQDVRNHDP